MGANGRVGAWDQVPVPLQGSFPEPWWPSHSEDQERLWISMKKRIPVNGISMHTSGWSFMTPKHRGAGPSTLSSSPMASIPATSGPSHGLFLLGDTPLPPLTWPSPHLPFRSHLNLISWGSLTRTPSKLGPPFMLSPPIQRLPLL